MDDLAAVALELCGPDGLGVTTTLLRQTMSRAATGGAINIATTMIAVNAAVVEDKMVIADAKNVRRIEAYLAGADPAIGDQLPIAGGTFRIVEAERLSANDQTAAWRVVLT